MLHHKTEEVRCTIADPQWSDWLDGLTITHEPDGTSRLHGVVRDQAALYGLITRLRDLGLDLIAVTPEPLLEARASDLKDERERSGLA
ncbi:MAG: hypothetical protein HGA45_04130 [Chloroflexales bacterium]|nr:hypothetical protein [Chloroflexales bacterium]